jgi:predicted AAA+ superfamily ATPase
MDARVVSGLVSGKTAKLAHISKRFHHIYANLIKGPSFPDPIKDPLPRDQLVKEVQRLITPQNEPGGYSLIVGEHGTGKSSLITVWSLMNYHR